MKVLICLFLAVASLACCDEKVQVYFSPDERVDQKLIEQIEKEKKSIHAAIYCLSHFGIEKALTAAKERGVAVEIIVDPFSLKQRGVCKRLAKAGVPLFVFDPKGLKKNERAPLMHDKFCIFGGERVWTGSFNFTHAASRFNQENALLLSDVGLAKRYEERFQKIKKESCCSYASFEGK